MPKFKFYYFNLYGRAEPTRMMMNYKSLDFEDCRVEFSQWPGTLKEELGGTGMPVIVFQDGRKFNQFQAIHRYIAMKCGLYPTDPAMAYDNDRICEDWNDYIDMFAAPSSAKSPEEKAELSKTAFMKVCTFIDSLKPFLENKTSGFLFGDKLMSADFMVGMFFTTQCMNPDMFGQDVIDMFLAKYPWFVAYGKRFAAENKAYLDSRPKCPF